MLRTLFVLSSEELSRLPTPRNVLGLTESSESDSNLFPSHMAVGGACYLFYLALAYIGFTSIWAGCCILLAKRGYQLTRAPLMGPLHLPLFGHALYFAVSPRKIAHFARILFEGLPIRLRLVVQNPILLTSHKDAEIIAKNPARLNCKPYYLHLTQVFGHPHSFKELVLADTSDLSRKAHSAADEDIDTRWENVTYSQISKALTGHQLTGHVERFTEKLVQSNDNLISTEWIEHTDLYDFVYSQMFPPILYSLFGNSLIYKCPQFSRWFTKFDSYWITLAQHVPAWWNPKPYVARKQCLEALKRWKRTLPSPEVCPDYQEVQQDFGSNLHWQRHRLFGKLGMSEDAIASEELAFIWGASANTIHTAFWLFLELLQSPQALSRFRACLEECPSSTNESGLRVWDSQELSKQAWMQSFYTEVGRRYIAVFIMRSTTEPIQLENFTVQAGETVMVNIPPLESDQPNFPAPSLQPEHQLSECWPERFLMWEDGKEVFKAASTAWTSYGIGANMCPGRFFARQEILTTASFLIGNFDLELVGPVKAKPDWSCYGIGSVGAKGAQPFRLRVRGGV